MWKCEKGRKREEDREEKEEALTIFYRIVSKRSQTVLGATKGGNAHRRRLKGVAVVDAEQSHENGSVERSNELENVGGAN